MTGTFTFPFGKPVKDLVQQDRSPKSVFVLGVYASAVHARWIGVDDRQKVAALAVDSEPCIFWDGEGAERIVADIAVPVGAGKLICAPPHMNGPSGRSLDEKILTPLGISRNDAWLCDIVPHSCMNRDQERAIHRAYTPLVSAMGLPPASVPRRQKPIPPSEKRRGEILLEIEEAKPETIVFLGDEPIEFFLRFFQSKWQCLADFGKTQADYGKKHPAKIGEHTYQILPLVHPRQASRLGPHSREWYELHDAWMATNRNRA